MPEYDLEAEMGRSVIVLKVYDDMYAHELYAALCNMEWCKLDMMNILSENHWSVTWRTAAHIIADYRSAWYDEDYSDWYGSGSEGVVSDRIKADLAELGWVPRPK